jgi:hypothetical protein
MLNNTVCHGIRLRAIVRNPVAGVKAESTSGTTSLSKFKTFALRPSANSVVTGFVDSLAACRNLLPAVAA